MVETEENYPLIPDGVIAYLEKIFPNKYPTEELTPYQLGYGAGRQGLIEHLKQVKQWGEDKYVQD